MGELDVVTFTSNEEVRGTQDCGQPLGHFKCFSSYFHVFVFLVNQFLSFYLRPRS